MTYVLTLWLCAVLVGECIQVRAEAAFPSKQACEATADTAVRDVARQWGPLHYRIDCSLKYDGNEQETGT